MQAFTPIELKLRHFVNVMLAPEMRITSLYTMLFSSSVLLKITLTLPALYKYVYIHR